jgi:hypothetical protein
MQASTWQQASTFSAVSLALLLGLGPAPSQTAPHSQPLDGVCITTYHVQVTVCRAFSSPLFTSPSCIAALRASAVLGNVV